MTLNICVYKLHFIHIFYSTGIAHVKSNSFKDGVIYFGELSLFHVNLSSLIAGSKSNKQITYLMTIEHNPELESQLFLLILSLAQVYQIPLPAIFLKHIVRALIFYVFGPNICKIL